MSPTTPKKAFTVLAHRTGDPYYDFGAYMPADRVREADADWLQWRADVQKAMEGIDSTLEAAQEAIPADFNATHDAFMSARANPDQVGRAPGLRQAVHVLIAAQHDAIDVAKAHLAVAMGGQAEAAKQAQDEKALADAAQRQARISNYISAGALLIAAMAVFYGFAF